MTLWKSHKHTEEYTHSHTYNIVHNHSYSVWVGACEKWLPPPLREHRKLETIQRLHAGFSSKLFPPQQPVSEQAQHPIRPTTYPLGTIFLTQGSCCSTTHTLQFPLEVRFTWLAPVTVFLRSRLGDIHLHATKRRKTIGDDDICKFPVLHTCGWRNDWHPDSEWPQKTALIVLMTKRQGATSSWKG